VLRKHAGFALLVKAEWRENRLKAERALRGAKKIPRFARNMLRNPSNRERRAKPETEPLLTRWGKCGVFSKHSAGATQTVFSAPILTNFEL